MLIAVLALRDLMRDRFFLLCNVAILVGTLGPLLVLVGVKNGVYDMLIGQLLSDPANLRIDTIGNHSLTEADIAPLRDLPGLAFLTPRLRGGSDLVNTRAEGGRRLRVAQILPSGPGDPVLPEGFVPQGDSVAISAGLARHLSLAPGARIEIVTQAEDRPRQLRLLRSVGAVLPEGRAAGDAVLAPFATLDLIEAFYDGYALPEYGIVTDRPLSARVPRYAGLRAYAASLEDLAPVHRAIEAGLGIGARAETDRVAARLGLGRNMDLALLLTAGVAGLGVAAAMVFAFWNDVARKRGVLATLAVLGFPARSLALFPLVQAAVTAAVGIALSFALYAGAARVAAAMFGAAFAEGASVAVIGAGQAAAITGLVMALVIGAAGFAAWSAQRLDPAQVLREGSA